MTVKPPPHSIAITPGIYDNIQSVLSTMGFAAATDYDIIEADEAALPGALDGYRYYFINCGHDLDPLNAGVQANIRGFVEGGGSLYASDWALDVVLALWPAALTDGGQTGAPELVDATVLDEELEAYLGKNAVSLDYNLGAWWTLVSVGAGTTEMIRGSSGFVSGRPLLVQFEAGDGRVTYTTFHNEAQTTFDMDRILAFLVFTL